ncbi:hypothetical protein V9L05_08275 [Bernardetia sp. Wsw4-3y2]|uniref:hypothetical protein n=1 Tax=Bernardetia sp. Wsw4-3y2 TaxID=3127471 RepID=UPI0030CA8891
MSYKIILNILILFLCTSCCACGDECWETTEAFYLRPIDKITGENILIKYDTLIGDFYLTDSFNNKVNATVRETTWYDNPPYLIVGVDEEGYITDKLFKLWIKDMYIGSFVLKTQKTKANIISCCSYYKINELKFIESTISLTKQPQEEKQPFYEIKF